MFLYAAQSSVLKFETECQGLCVNRKCRYFGCNILGPILAKISAQILAKISERIFAKISRICQNFKNFDTNLNKIFNKILVLLI